MTTHTLPESWIAPRWHADFGDVQGELEHLRSLANAILSRSKELAVDLQSPEPGLMLLVISRAGGILAEIYSILESKNSSARRYGVFLFPGSPREQEEYAETAGKAVDLLYACDNQSARSTDIKTAVGHAMPLEDNVTGRPLTNG